MRIGLSLLLVVATAFASGDADATVPRTIGALRAPSDMVRVPATRTIFAFETPSGRVGEPRTISAFWIDRLEVTVKRYAACVHAGRCKEPSPIDTQSPTESSVCTWKSAGKEHHPLNCVTWEEARSLCAYEGKRLPTEYEFEVASAGADARRFPWGNMEPTPKHLNACDDSCVGQGPSIGQSFDSMYEGKTPSNDGFPFTAPVGSFPAGASPFGALDLAGNVEEWTADKFSDLGGTPAPGPSGEILRVVRGGSWDLSTADSFYTSHRSDIGEQQRTAWLGFRCARSA